MRIDRIGFMTPGDMGQAVAMQLREKGCAVLTALDGRSERSRKLAREAGLVDVGSIARLCAEADVVMSVMNPGAALSFAQQAAQAIRDQAHKPLFVDCNAIAPDTMHAIAEAMAAAGAPCLDASLIGPPPRKGAKVHLYVSGPRAHDLDGMGTPQLLVHPMGERIGDASALKMCYGAINKGTQALILEALIAARRLGVEDALEEQLLGSRADLYKSVLGWLPLMPAKAYRWVPEMREIASTFSGTGLTRNIFEGAAELYEFVAGTELGKESPETRDPARTGKMVVQRLADEKPGR